MHTKEELKKDLLALGIRPGDTVLIHSSYKAMGGIEEGAKGFFDTVMELLGEEGTLVIPTLSFSTVTWDNPYFDRNETPSCVGYLTEYFRTSVPGVRRSMHATHSCAAWGKHRDYLIDGHELDRTPVGENSPFHKLPKLGGKILMLGCRADSNTSFHGIEETAEPPFLFRRENPIHYTMRDGERVIEMDAHRHYFLVNGVHLLQRYSRILPLLDEEELHVGKILDANCYLMDAASVWKKGRNKMLEDPYFFVEDPPRK